MNFSILTFLIFFAFQHGWSSNPILSEEKERQKNEILSHGQYTFDEFKGLILPHLDESLHGIFEKGFETLFVQGAHRIPHGDENKHIACFFEDIAGHDLGMQEIVLASRFVSRGHTRFLSKDTLNWANGILD